MLAFEVKFCSLPETKKMTGDHSMQGNTTIPDGISRLCANQCASKPQPAPPHKFMASQLSSLVFRKTSAVYGSQASEWAEFNSVTRRKPLTSSFSTEFDGRGPWRNQSLDTSIARDRFMKGQCDWMDKNI